MSFLGGIQHSPVNGFSAVSCNFRALIGEDDQTSSYSTVFSMDWNVIAVHIVFTDSFNE